MTIGIRGFGAAVAVTLAAFVGTAEAAVVPVGDLCGNKYISLTQGGAFSGDAIAPTMCQSGNSTGGPTSPIGMLGWTDGGEVAGTGGGPSGDLGLSVNVSTGLWSILSPSTYASIGVSIKQGNGFAFYILDLSKALSGYFYTGNNASPTGHGLSHANAWYKGETPPPSEVPVPAAGLLLVGGLGALAAVRRRKAKTV
jgi:hypothetical protein